MKYYTTSILTLCLALLAWPATAQPKIAVIDLRRVFDEYHKTKTADAALKERAGELDKERKSLIDVYQKIKEDYEKALNSANDQAVSADERDKRKKTAEGKLLELREKEQEITQFDRTARASLDEDQRRRRDNILAEIRTVINGRAKAGSYGLVIDIAAETINKTPVVLYSNGENDLTGMVLDQLNATAPPTLPKADSKKDDKKN
jgi:Skp family chaperone for outer membrane proteins